MIRQWKNDLILFPILQYLRCLKRKTGLAGNIRQFIFNRQLQNSIFNLVPQSISKQFFFIVLRFFLLKLTNCSQELIHTSSHFLQLGGLWWILRRVRAFVMKSMQYELNNCFRIELEYANRILFFQRAY